MDMQRCPGTDAGLARRHLPICRRESLNIDNAGTTSPPSFPSQKRHNLPPTFSYPLQLVSHNLSCLSHTSLLLPSHSLHLQSSQLALVGRALALALKGSMRELLAFYLPHSRRKRRCVHGHSWISTICQWELALFRF